MCNVIHYCISINYASLLIDHHEKFPAIGITENLYRAYIYIRCGICKCSKIWAFLSRSTGADTEGVAVGVGAGGVCTESETRNVSNNIYCIIM